MGFYGRFHLGELGQGAHASPVDSKETSIRPRVNDELRPCLQSSYGLKSHLRCFLGGH